MSVFALAQEENLPCCTFVALAVLEGDGAAINSVNDGVRARGMDWWTRANVWDLERPWSALDAAKEVFGGYIRHVPMVGPTAAPELTPGCWHVVQRWKHLDQGGSPGPQDDTVRPGHSTGHTYLAYREGAQVRIVQSSVAKGYRDSEGSWEGTAGLDGYTVSVLTFPEGVSLC